MTVRTQLGAIKTLCHALKIHEFPECGGNHPVEAFLAIQARFKALERATEERSQSDPDHLEKCRHEFEFIELVLGRVRSFIDVQRPLEPVELLSAVNAMQFIARKLQDLPNLPEHEGESEEEFLATLIGA